MLEPLMHASPFVLLLLALWKLPQWGRKWVAVARDVREFWSGR